MPKRRTSVTRQIRIIRNSLSSIVEALNRLAPVLSTSSARDQGGPTVRRRKLRLSPARRAALKVQGQYMGYLRGLKPRQKARAMALRAAKGVRAAIGFVKRLAPALPTSGAGGRSAPRTGRKLRISPARRAALKVQGQYMGYLRGLKPRQKARVKALRSAKGVRAAIAEAKRLAS